MSDEVEKTECATIIQDVTQYAWGALSEDLRPTVAAHLAQCVSCRELVSFVSEFVAAASEGGALRQAPAEHPDPSLIVDLEADDLNEKDAREVSLHLLDCKTCREAYLLLRSLSDEQFEERVWAEQPWPVTLAKAMQLLIDLGKVYGSGTRIGPIQVLSERVALGAKVLEVPVGENVYRVQAMVTEAGFLSFDIAGSRTPVRAQLGVWVCSGAGENLISTKTDNSGNLHFEVPRKVSFGDLLVVTFSLKGTGMFFVFRVAARQRSAVA
jgi:hypothetical protein